MPRSSAMTHGISVEVESRYMEDHSSPEDGQWFFAYQITIENRSDKTVQLLTREWVITNAAGRIDVVRGPGVVGVQPTLAPGEGFQYTSGCPLDTAFGSMRGKYAMRTAEGDMIDVDIAEFSLVEPSAVN